MNKFLVGGLVAVGVMAVGAIVNALGNDDEVVESPYAKMYAANKTFKQLLASKLKNQPTGDFTYGGLRLKVVFVTDSGGNVHIDIYGTDAYLLAGLRTLLDEGKFDVALVLVLTVVREADNNPL